MLIKFSSYFSANSPVIITIFMCFTHNIFHAWYFSQFCELVENMVLKETKCHSRWVWLICCLISMLKITFLSDDNIKFWSWIIHFFMLEKNSPFLFVWLMFLHQSFMVKLISCPSIPRQFVCKSCPISMGLWILNSFQNEKDLTSGSFWKFLEADKFTLFDGVIKKTCSY